MDGEFPINIWVVKVKKGGATMRMTRRRSQNERKQPNQASRGEKKIKSGQIRKS